ncbi:MAG: putative sensor domain DACNV-containing protein [Minicystis sp.]
MNEERLGSSRQFASEVVRHLAAFAEPRWPLPSDDDLAQLIEVTFFASLHEEETRRAEFNVAWQPSADDCAAVVGMATPVPATPKNLTKLAPATQQEATSIAVRRQGNDLVAWALLQRSSSSGSPLTVWALGPGVLRVDYAGIPRALYARGEILLLGGAHEVTSPARRLTQAFAQWRPRPTRTPASIFAPRS